MPNIPVSIANQFPVYVKATGSGSDADPFILSLGVGASPVGASSVYLGVVSGQPFAVASAEFNCCASGSAPTAYSINDIVSSGSGATTPLTLANVVPAVGGTGTIVKVRVATSGSGTVPAFRVWFFTTNTYSAPADNAPFALMWANRAAEIGYIDLPAMAGEGGGDSTRAMTDTDVGVTAFVCAAADRNIYAILETKTAFTPAAAQSFYLEVTVLPA